MALSDRELDGEAGLKCEESRRQNDVLLVGFHKRPQDMRALACEKVIYRNTCFVTRKHTRLSRAGSRTSLEVGSPPHRSTCESATRGQQWSNPID